MDLFETKTRKRRQSQQSISVYREQVLPTLNERSRDVFRWFTQYPTGLSTNNIAAIMGVSLHTASTWLDELQSAGYIEKTGKKSENSQIHKATGAGLDAFYEQVK